jgi:hypothetical protein
MGFEPTTTGATIEFSLIWFFKYYATLLSRIPHHIIDLPVSSSYAYF